jgi:hypothetical protein
VIRTIWPYKEGYGVHCKKCHLLLDSGLSRNKAKAICTFENARAEL